MSQSNVIAGALVIAFVIFITVRGELDDYLHLFAVRKKTGGSNTGGNIGQTVGDIIGSGGSDTLGGDIGTDDVAKAAALFAKYGKYFI